MQRFFSFCLLFLILTCNSLFSQSAKSFVSLRAGSSIPLGGFSSYDLNESSFAMPGIAISADGAWFFLPYLGVGAQAGFNLNPIDVSVLGYETVQADPFLVDMTIRSEAFQTYTTTAGIYGKWNFWKSLSLSGNVSVGWMWAITPYQLYKPTYFGVASKWYEKTPSKDNGFIAVPSIGLVYDFKTCIGLKADAEYYYKKLSFGFEDFNGVYYSDRVINFLNISLGLIVYL
jgi:hypothetical protein